MKLRSSFLFLFVALASADSLAQTPVIVLHGLFRDGNAWEVQSLRNFVVGRGIPANRVFTPTMPNTLDCVETTSAWFQNVVQGVLNQTGATKVDVIAHSLGGIVTRHYINFRNGHLKVRKFVEIASPNYGTWSPLITPLPFCSAQQVLPWSWFLAYLNANGTTKAPTQYGTVVGSNENIVLGYTSAHLPGAQNRTAWGADHFNVVYHAETHNLIRSMLGI